MKLVVPATEHLSSYREALERGFSPNNVEQERVRLEQLALLESDPEALLARMTDPEAKGPPIRMPDGSTSPRLPGVTRWMWDEDQFCGSINLRWQEGTDALPPHVPGHIGFVVPEWRRQRGYASAMLRSILEEAWRRGLGSVLLTAEPGNAASRGTIEKLGGEEIGRFDSGDAHHACHAAVLYRIALSERVSD